MAQKDVDMKDAAEEDHQKEGDKQKEPDEQQAKKDKDLLAFEGKPQFSNPIRIATSNVHSK